MPDYLEVESSPTVHKYYNAQAIGLLGLIVWEMIVTFPFEWRFFKQRSRPHWTLVFYTGSRLSLTTHLVSIVVNLFDREALPCNAQTWIMRITASIVICFSGTILAIRVISQWPRLEHILSPVGVLLAILVVINCLTWQTPDNVWDSTLSRCVARAAVHKAITLAQFLYTFVFFLVLTVLYAWRHLPLRGFSKIRKLFTEEGTGIFAIVTVVFLGQAVISCIWKSDLVILLFVPVALAITVIAISRSYVDRYRESERKEIPTTARRLPGHGPSTINPVPSSWRRSSAFASTSKV